MLAPSTGELITTCVEPSVGVAGTGGGAGGGGPVSNRFTAGVAHIDGRYRFTQNNYLMEGAQKIRDLGSDSIFSHLSRMLA